jgi:hypothetical protein
MRIVTALSLMLLLVCGVLADDTQQTPRESYEAFVKAVLDNDMKAEARQATFARYFDFDTWVKNRAAREGKVYTKDEQTELREQWFELFASDEFRDTYRNRDVKILEEPEPDRDKGRAELVISIQTTEGETKKFRVLMTLSQDGSHWRWYSIPRIQQPAAKLTREQKIARIEQGLKLIADKRNQLDAQEKALRIELKRLRAELAEKAAGNSPFATPRSVVETAWKAIEKGSADRLLDCHTTQRVRESKLDDVNSRLGKLRKRLMSWEIVDSTIDENDPGRATVRVKLKLQRTGDSDGRTISVPVVRDGDDWKIDEAP